MNAYHSLSQKDFGKGKMKLIISKSYGKKQQKKAEKFARVSV